MSKQIVITIGFLLSLSSILFAGGDLKKMTIYFDNLSSNDGWIMILVQDAQEKDVAKLVLSIHGKTAKADIFLPSGRYGVTAFHDLNGDEKLEKNMLGVPTEPYGFSNNVRAILSKPNIEDLLIDLSNDQLVTFELKGYP